MSLSPLVRFGTSTWAYEGWRGMVYHNLYAPGRFKQDCLAEYARHEYRGAPLFRTVGLDATFYRPPADRLLAHYARQLPPGFPVCSKVWESITIPRYPELERYGEQAGKPNPRFLDAALFRDEVLAPYERAFQDHTGPFIFEFQRTGIAPEEFVRRLDEFLGNLPKDFAYAVEVRNPRLLGPLYADVLRRHGTAHVYDHWTYMPPLAAQHEALGGAFTAPFLLLRLLTPLRVKYEQAVRIAEPYDKIVQEIPSMRAEAATLIRQAVEEGRKAFAIVNNRAEGCAPLTVQALVDRIA